jgi:PAS domain S-box-containing protein
VSLRDWPIRRKFSVGTLLVTLPAIAFVSIFLIITENRSVREARLATAKTVAGMIAANGAAAVIFDDQKVAQQILSGVTAEPGAEAAALYDAQGTLYARFPTNTPLAELPAPEKSVGATFTATRLEVFADAIYEGRRVGAAYLRINLSEMRQRLLIYAATVFAISCLAVLLVILLSRLLERWIATPMLELSQTAQSVAAKGDYSLRAEKRGSDEVGALVDAFNQMLNEIQRSQSERQRALEALRENEAVLRTVTTEAQVGLVMVNKEHRYRFANQTYADILGLPDANIVGRRIAEVLPALYSEQVQPRLNRAFNNERINYELHMPAHPRTGEEKFYEVVYEPRIAGGEEPYVVVVIVDVTHRKRAQQTLERTVQERTAKLRETVGDLEAFSYSIAHDMRAPLRSMIGFSNILTSEKGASLDDDGRDYLRRIQVSAERLDRLIQDVLNYSKVVRGELKLERIDVTKLIREIIESYPNLQAPNAEITLQSPLPHVLGNAAALTQVFSNLLGNAAKFVTKGVHPKIAVYAETFDGRVRFWVEDNGIGIEAEAQKRLFKIFQRVQRPELYEGTGIGLAIVRKAVERMGGRVGVESQVNKGSKFWVELERAP